MPRSSADLSAGPADGLTIEQLAAASGVAFTTIRLYQQRGLLPPPVRRGRIGYYDAAHRARPELIANLRDRGYSLAAIKDLVDTWQDGRSLTQVLGLEATVAETLAIPPELRLRPDELAARFHGVELTAAAMQRAYDLGLVAFEEDVVIVRDPVFLDVGASLAEMGVPVDEILDEYEELRQVTSHLAERFTALFERNLWPRVVDRGLPDELDPLTESLASLSPMAEQIVVSSLRRAIAEQAVDFLGQRAKELG